MRRQGYWKWRLIASTYVYQSGYNNIYCLNSSITKWKSKYILYLHIIIIIYIYMIIIIYIFHCIIFASRRILDYTICLKQRIETNLRCPSFPRICEEIGWSLQWLTLMDVISSQLDVTSKVGRTYAYIAFVITNNYYYYYRMNIFIMIRLNISTQKKD